jgi:hypothetical protein
MSAERRDDEYYLTCIADNGAIVNGTAPRIPVNSKCRIVVDLLTGELQPRDITGRFVIATIYCPNGNKDIMAEKGDSRRGRVIVPIYGDRSAVPGTYNVRIREYIGGGELATVARFSYIVFEKKNNGGVS